MTTTHTDTTSPREALAECRAMIARYEQAVALHPSPYTPLNRRQQAEVANLLHWRATLTRLHVHRAEVTS
ncbi:hypothetical protein [Leifsonia aquatica]|uniref:hypothetical protein n=1 Tax=Leifsonia aquatica TaxID=144185 RepID=UPI00382CCE06